MVSVTFDTLKFANRLKAAGVPDKQAEAEAEALAEVMEINLRDLATKEDLERFKTDIQRDLRELEQRMIGLEQRMEDRLQELEQRMEGRLRELEQRMTIKLGALMAVAVGVVAALVKLL